MEEFKQLLSASYDICEKYELSEAGILSGCFQKMLQDELVNMGYIIACMDGEFDRKELYTIKTSFDLIYTEDMLRQKYNQNCEHRINFMNNVPDILKTIMRYEKKNYSVDMVCFLRDTRIVHKTFKQFGYQVIMSNSIRNKLQVEALEKFTSGILREILRFEEDIFDCIGADHSVADEFTVSTIIQLREINAMLKEIDEMVGLEEVKKEIRSLVNLLIIRKLREERGLKQPVMAMHLVFTGNPGTGKTTIARKMAEIYKCLGFLDKGHLVETDRAGMVAGYMGQTAGRVKELADKAMGGILFIDEAYTLAGHNSTDDYGQEAIDTLLKILEDSRDNLVVIVAGYPEPMEEFLNSNPGLRSRFNKFINFEDYTSAQLSDIFLKMCKSHDYELADDAHEDLHTAMNMMINKSLENFANAREVRNYFENVISRQAERIIKLGEGNIKTLLTIIKEDLMV